MKLISVCLLVCLLLGACGPKEKVEEIGIIPLKEGIKDPVQWKVSEFFRRIRYVPLELTDSSVIGAHPTFLFYKDRIWVGSDDRLCMVFGQETGKFIRTIGSRDKGPQGYTTSRNAWINPETEELYFRRGDDKYVKYSLEGKFLGVVKIPEALRTDFPGALTYIDKEHLALYFSNVLGNERRWVTVFNHQGEITTSFPNPQQTDSLEIVNYVILKGAAAREIYGDLETNQVILGQGKQAGESTILSPSEEKAFWHYAGNTYFKESYNDTIFQIRPDEKQVRGIFDLGEYHWDYREKFQMTHKGIKAVVRGVEETDRYVFFRYTCGGNFCGLWDKQEARLYTTFFEKHLTDDVHDFMPLTIRGVAGPEELMGYIQPYDLLEWFEEHPEGELDSEILPLKKLREEDNPVVVLMQLKK